MPLVVTKEWFEIVPKIWNSDPANVKNMSEVKESILWIADDLPLARMPEALVKSILETGMIDPESWQLMKQENRIRMIINIQEGVIKEFRPATPDDKPTAVLSGKYSAFEKIVKREADLLWQVMDGELKFKGPLPRFTKHLDHYVKLVEIFISNTELP